MGKTPETHSHTFGSRCNLYSQKSTEKINEDYFLTGLDLGMGYIKQILTSFPQSVGRVKESASACEIVHTLPYVLYEDSRVAQATLPITTLVKVFVMSSLCVENKGVLDSQLLELKTELILRQF